MSVPDRLPYAPVASIVTCVHPAFSSHSASANNPSVVVAKHLPLYLKASLQEPGVSRPACGQAARPQYSLRESDGESAPTANRSAESFHTYSGSTKPSAIFR